MQLALGSYRSALQYCEKALQISLKYLGPEHYNVAHSLNNIGQILLMLGDLEGAKDKHHQALQIFRKTLGEQHLETAKTYHQYATIYHVQERFDSALYYCQKALNIREGTLNPSHYDVGETYELMAELKLAQSEYPEALAYYHKAINMYSNSFGAKHQALASLWNGVGTVYLKQGQSEKALEAHQKALKGLVSSFAPATVFENPVLDENTPYKNDLIETLRLKAHTLAQQYLSALKGHHSLEAATEAYQLAIQLATWALSGYNDYNDKLSMSERALPLYKEAIMAATLLNSERPSPALHQRLFTLTQLCKSGVLRASLQQAKAVHFSGIPDSLTTLEHQLLVDISYYQTQLAQLEPQGNPNDSLTAQEYKERLFHSQYDYERLLALFEKQYQNYYQLKYQQKVIAVDDVQHLLNKQEAFVEYFVGDTTILACVIAPGLYETLIIPKPDQLNEQAKALRQSLSNATFVETSLSSAINSYTSNAHDLYQLLIAPVLATLPNEVSQLIIAPDGILATLPFETLLTKPVASVKAHDFGKLPYLCKAFAVSYAYSASLWTEQLRIKLHKKRPKGRFAGFAPHYDGLEIAQSDTLNQPLIAALHRGGEYNLPGTIAEVSQISKLFEGDLWLNEQATEQNFKSVANGYQLLHLAMHGLVDDQRPALSKLLFTPSDSTAEDSYLHAAEIYATPVNADMVVLSACNTGFGQIQNGEGVMSLSRAFAYAGCPSVVNSLWRANDRATAQIMVAFYKGLKKGLSKAKALRQAKLHYLENTSGYMAHPYYWGAFVVNGDARAVAVSDEGMHWGWWATMGAVLLVLGLLFRRRRSKSIA